MTQSRHGDPLYPGALGVTLAWALVTFRVTADTLPVSGYRDGLNTVASRLPIGLADPSSPP